MLNGLELSIPALFLFGMQSSPHCALMCGGLQLANAGHPRNWVQMQLLRLLSYSVMGVLAGGLGRQIIWYLPQNASPWLWRLGLGSAIVAAGLSLSWRRLPRQTSCPKQNQQRRPAWAAAWAFMPCPMLYAALGIAIFSAHPINGGLLILAFAIGTLPMHSLQMLSFRCLPLKPNAGFSLTYKTRGYFIALSGCVILLSGLWLPANSLFLCKP